MAAQIPCDWHQLSGRMIPEETVTTVMINVIILRVDYAVKYHYPLLYTEFFTDE